jgi:LuxR family maltose regulon positive regulatory protein
VVEVETTLLATKLYIPPVRPGLVTRPRLLERLQACLNHNLTLVSAPAGFGKTTLLSDWVHHSQPSIPTAWLSLEEGDNDARRFWEYFIAALKKIEPAAGESCLPLLRSTQTVPVENILTSLINDITSIPGDFILVLDDYHSIQSSPVHQGLAFLLEHVPPGMHLVIATRVDPPLPLARFRGRGTLLEIGVDDLRFTHDEVARLVAEMNVLPLSSENINALNAKAEGWVAGLKMAILSMRRSKDIAAFIADFTGSQRYIMDYLVEEVLQQQTVEVRDFLLQTSILDRLNGPLCNAVTQSTKGQEILLNLEQANLFIVPLDMSRQWYRYHNLFRELLQHRLMVESGDDGVRSLHLKASRWYESNGLLEDAINHALAARDWEKAMELISKPEIQSYAVGSFTMLNWLKQIPEEILRAHMPIYWNYIWALGGTGQYKATEDCLKYLDGVAEHDEYLQGKIAVARAFIAANTQDFRLSEEYARKALLLLPPDDIGISLISGTLAGIYMVQGRWVESEPLIRRNYESLVPSWNAVLPLTYIGLITFFKGNLHEAAKTYREAIELAEKNKFAPTVCLAHLYLGVVYSEWNDLETAALQKERAIEKFQPIRTFGGMQLDQAYLSLASTRMAQGETERAMKALEKADQLLSQYEPDPVSRARNAAIHVDIAFSQGDEVSSSRWMTELVELEDFIPDGVPFSALRLLDMRKGKKAAAEKHQTSYELYARQGFKTFMIRTRVLQALNASELDNALEFLTEALALAKPEGFIRIFVDWGMPMASLLRKAISRGIEPIYAQKLLDIIEAEERERRIRKGEIPALVTASGTLSERELEVLRLVADGLSNQQIAKRLFITTGTVKTHVHNIIEKLYAQSRTNAISRARELKLI